MFHEEKIIDGLLHYRTMPDGEWTPYTAEQLTEKIEKMKAEHSEQIGRYAAMVRNRDRYIEELAAQIDGEDDWD